MTSRWRGVGLDDVQLGVGVAACAAPTEDRVHVLATRPDGRALSHIGVTRGGRTQQLPDLPLGWVSSVGPIGDDLVVAGATPHDGAPALVLHSRAGVTTVVALPDPWTGRSATAVAAWPVVVASDRPSVLWAMGAGPATVVVGRIVDGAVEATATSLTQPTIWSLDAAPGEDGIDVLVHGVEGRLLARVTGSSVEALAAPLLPAGALLGRGAVLWPVAAGGEHAFAAWDVRRGVLHDAVLPAPPEGRNAWVQRAWPVDEYLMAWTTVVPDAFRTHGSTAGRSLAARSWLGRHDGAWRVDGPPVELPAPDALVLPMGDGIVAVSRDPGLLRIWVADCR